MPGLPPDGPSLLPPHSSGAATPLLFILLASMSGSNCQEELSYFLLAWPGLIVGAGGGGAVGIVFRRHGDNGLL